MIVLSNSKVRARRDHTCIWCGEIINVGESYYRCFGIYCREPLYQKYHLECNEAAARIAVEEGEFEFSEYEFKRGTTEER